MLICALRRFAAAFSQLLASGFLLYAAHGAAAPQREFEVWHAEDNWPEKPVSTILQTRDGYLWLGTYTGLLRFDGVKFEVFDSGNTPRLRNSRVTSLYEDSENRLWIGHETGEVTTLEAGVFTPVVVQWPWPGGALESIVADEVGDLWLLNDSAKLVRLRDGRTLECPGGGSPGLKASVSRQRDGTIWTVASGTASMLRAGSLRPARFDPTPQDDYCQKIIPARDGGVWVLNGPGRVRKWTGRTWAEDLGELSGVTGSVLLETSKALLVGTLNDGLHLLRPDAEPRHFSRTNGLRHNWVRAICEDHEGNIWVGTSAGLHVLRVRSVEMLHPPDHFNGFAAMSLTQSRDGALWVGTEGAGLYRFSAGEWTSFTESHGMSNLFVWSVLETRSGDLLAGTWGGGLFRRNQNRFSSDMYSAPSDTVLAMHEDRNGSLWLGTTLGLHKLERGKTVWSVGRDKLTLPDVRAITETPDGVIWFGMSGGGLGSVTGDQLRQYRKQDGLGSDFVQALLPDPDGALWIGTSDSGLCRLKDGSFSRVGPEHGLPASVLCHLLEDAKGFLWSSSDRGIFRLDKAELDRCMRGEIKTVRPRVYGKADGLTTLNCSGGFHPGALRASDGRLWFPTARGVAVIDPANVQMNRVIPPVVIESFTVAGEKLDPALLSSQQAPSYVSRLTIRPGKQRYQIHYTALSFSSPDKVLFKYKLNGLESDWVDAGTARVAEYSYLPPGDYEFQVMACNNDDLWNEAGASLAFSVLPHVWQTWWFTLGTFLGGAVVVGAGMMFETRRRIRRKLEQLERQRALERERARIARDIHDDLGASLTRITMLSQSVRSEIGPEQQAADDVDRIYQTARELTRAMDEIVWAVNPKHDTLDSLVTYLGRFAQSFLSTVGLRCRLEVPVSVPAWALTSEIRHNIFLAVKEALNNVVKHAGATEVRILFELHDDAFTLAVVDNGCGFNPIAPEGTHPADPARSGGGNGLINMRRRLEEVGGECEWRTAPGEGTRVILKIPVTLHRQ